VSVGIKDAVTIDVPAPATVAVRPLREMTEGDPEVYVKVPATFAVATSRLKFPFPYVRDRQLEFQVFMIGVALLIVTAPST
jgi:hypothetical protein